MQQCGRDESNGAGRGGGRPVRLAPRRHLAGRAAVQRGPRCARGHRRGPRRLPPHRRRRRRLHGRLGRRGRRRGRRRRAPSHQPGPGRGPADRDHLRPGAHRRPLPGHLRRRRPALPRRRGGDGGARRGRGPGDRAGLALPGRERRRGAAQAPGAAHGRPRQLADLGDATDRRAQRPAPHSARRRAAAEPDAEPDGARLPDHPPARRHGAAVARAWRPHRLHRLLARQGPVPVELGQHPRRPAVLRTAPAVMATTAAEGGRP